MRSPLSFACEGAELIGSLDEAPATTGLLIVTGGTQVRAGAHGGQSRLAATIAQAGFPVFRFDRRGVGDSGGDDPDFAASAPDLASAAAAFRAAAPHLTRMVGYGVCDGATALALHGAAAGLDALVMANPWVIEPSAGLPPPAAIRSRYRERLTSLVAWRRLLSGGIDIGKAIRGLRAAARPADASLADKVAQHLDVAKLPTTILLAERDNTAIAFAAAAKAPAFRTLSIDTLVRPSASHGFAADGDAEWLAERLLAILRAAERGSSMIA